jgi:hypothetical protein
MSTYDNYATYLDDLARLESLPVWSTSDVPPLRTRNTDMF